jgi:copper chaperone CopZ
MKTNLTDQSGYGQVDAQSEKVRLIIDGMTCGSCVSRVEKALEGVAGVESASVDLVSKTAEVSIRPGVMTDLLVKTVEAIGYGAGVAPAQKGRLDNVPAKSPSCCCGPG